MTSRLEDFALSDRAGPFFSSFVSLASLFNSVFEVSFELLYFLVSHSCVRIASRGPLWGRRGLGRAGVSNVPEFGAGWKSRTKKSGVERGLVVRADVERHVEGLLRLERGLGLSRLSRRFLGALFQLGTALLGGRLGLFLGGGPGGLALLRR